MLIYLLWISNHRTFHCAFWASLCSLLFIQVGVTSFPYCSTSFLANIVSFMFSFVTLSKKRIQYFQNTMFTFLGGGLLIIPIVFLKASFCRQSSPCWTVPDLWCQKKDVEWQLHMPWFFVYISNILRPKYVLLWLPTFSSSWAWGESSATFTGIKCHVPLYTNSIKLWKTFQNWEKWKALKFFGVTWFCEPDSCLKG